MLDSSSDTCWAFFFYRVCAPITLALRSMRACNPFEHFSPLFRQVTIRIKDKKDIPASFAHCQNVPSSSAAIAPTNNQFAVFWPFLRDASVFLSWCFKVAMAVPSVFCSFALFRRTILSSTDSTTFLWKICRHVFGIQGKDLEMQWDLFVQRPNTKPAVGHLPGIRDLT